MKNFEKNNLLLHHIGEMMSYYFQGKIIKTYPLNANDIYLFGYHPHGIMPLTLIWLRVGTEWEKLFPGVTFAPLTASVMHLVPVMRDLLQWMGGREVSKESIQLALRNKRNCLLIPGGQAEMLESNSNIDEVVIITKHIGFVRLALQENVKLVPILSIGDVDILDNISLPIIQKWFLRRIGFAAPFNPYGLYYLPIPRPIPVTVIVGKPIILPYILNPTELEIKKYLFEYFNELKLIFDKYEHIAQKQLRKRKLVFKDNHGNIVDLNTLKQQWGI